MTGLLVSGSLSEVGDWDLLSTVTGDNGGEVTVAEGGALDGWETVDAPLDLRTLVVTPGCQEDIRICLQSGVMEDAILNCAGLYMMNTMHRLHK